MAENEETLVKETKKRGRKSKYEEQKITGKVKSDEFVEAASQIEKDTMISAQQVTEILIQSMEAAYLEWSYPGLFKDKNNPDPAKQLIRCRIDFGGDFNHFKIFDIKTVTNEDDIIDDAYQISLEDAQAIKKRAKLGDEIEIPFDVSLLSKAYVRRVKQLFQAKLKDASKQAILAIYSNQLNSLIDGIVSKYDAVTNTYEISFGKAVGFLKDKALIPGDRFNNGQRVTVYLSEISQKSNPPSLTITRSNKEFIKGLMERYIPEVANGEIKIKAISRIAGTRSKVFVESTNPNIDPIGACIGPENSRLRSILNELHSEKIDILTYHKNKALQIIEAMKPAAVIGLTCPEDFFDPNVHFEEIEFDPEYEFPAITVVVQNGGQAAAIGHAGSNVRLAGFITRTSISVAQADEAIASGVKYVSLSDIYRLAAEQQAILDAENKVEEVEETVEEIVEPVENDLPVEEKVEQPIEEKVVAEKKPAKVEVEKPVEEAEEHIEIKNKPKVSLAKLEEALSAKKGPSETKTSKKKDKKDEKKDSSAKTNISNALPIYTDEELESLDEEENFDEYEDDFDYDQYDEYYEDNN